MTWKAYIKRIKILHLILCDKFHVRNKINFYQFHCKSIGLCVQPEMKNNVQKNHKIISVACSGPTESHFKIWHFYEVFSIVQLMSSNLYLNAICKHTLTLQLCAHELQHNAFRLQVNSILRKLIYDYTVQSCVAFVHCLKCNVCWRLAYMTGLIRH